MSSEAGIPSERIREADKRFPKPEGLKFSYGTAGFRTKSVPHPIFHSRTWVHTDGDK